MPLANVSGGASDTMGGRTEGKATYPRDALALAWARARHLGQLDATLAGGPHNGYAYAGGKGSTVHGALIRMARTSGHTDLADAFAATAEKHSLSKNDAATLATLSDHYTQGKRDWEHIKTLVDRLGIADKTIGEVRDMKLGGPFAVSNTSYSYDNRNNRKIGAIVKEGLEH